MYMSSWSIYYFTTFFADPFFSSLSQLCTKLAVN
jgi:hypothetical protein